ncbi:expressed protein [Phakopsora pachyrhizi]|uniref:Expressed protein n=1 Tax=Phakopsora pachyrhizi TaxID=170000 RepID=A0AAV0AXH2_PHAPC|nr:expressed protein [Phakopsora pachyrhizi]
MVNGSSPISHSQNAPGRVSPAQLYHKSSGSFSSSIPNLVNPERLESHHISSNSDIPQSVIRISSESKPSDVTQTSSRGQSSALLFSHSAPISSSSSLPNASHSSVSSGPALSSSLFSPPHLAWSHGLPLAFKNACAQPNPAVGRNRSLTEDSSSSSLKTLNNYSPRIMNYASPSPSQSFRSPYISTYSESNCRRLSPSPRNSLARLTDQDREEPESRLRSTPSIRLVASSNSVGGYNQDMLHHHTTNQTSGFMSANSSPRLASTLSFGPSPASSSSPLFFNRPRPDLNHMIHLNPTNNKTSSFPPSPNLRGSPLSGTYNELCKSHKSEKIASTGLGLGLSIAGRSDSQKSSLSEEGQVGRDDEQHSKKLCHKISDINDSTGSRSSSTVSGLAILHMDLNSGRARQSIDSNSHTTASTPEPSLQVYKPDSTLSVHSLSHAQDSVMIDHSLSISENASKLAALFWDDDERLIKKDKLMEWLGGLESQSNQALNKLKSLTLKEYMAKFDFEGLRIDMGLRKLCTKLYIKGETQQVDRILAEFSKRFWDQNRTNLYFNTDMVHALSYSMLLLNTDLHVVDYHSRMSRSQFIKNTLETVYAQLPENLDDGSLLSSRDDDGGYQKASGGESNITSGESNEQGIPARASFENGIRRRRNSLADWSVRSNAPPARSSLDRWKEVFGRHNDAMDPQQSTFANYWSGNITSAENDSYSFAKSNLPHGGVSPQSVISTSRIPGLESSATTMSSDRDCPIEGVKGMKAVDDAINVVSSSSTSVSTTNSASYFSGGEQGRLEVEDSDRGRRRGSCFNMVENFSRSQFDKEIEVLLKDVYVSIKSQPIFNSARSDSPLRPGIQNSITLQRASSRRSPHSMLSSDRSGSGAGAGSKRASFRGLGGLLFAGPEISTGATRSISPTPSVGSTTQSACSMASGPQGYASTTGSHALTSLTTPSIGFVSNLSQSIIKELQEEESDENKDDTDQLGDDYEELALLGPPWAKEGILQRKQYWSSKGKRHKDKSWIQVFVVIAKGSLKMFRFGESSLGVGQSGGGSHIGEGDCQPPSDQARVGGGNWLVNAQIIGELSLSHSLTSALPSGYSKERPFAFVMTLSSGASYFFQAGTEELVNEWVSTCNYWSARLSKEPLTGGVSNMEYGWNQISDLDVAINAAGRNSSRGLIVKEKSHSPNKASQADSQDQEEMMSIMSGNSGHSHKSRKLRSRFFNGSNHSGHHHRHFLPPLPTLSPQSVSDGKRELNLSGLRPEDASDLNSPEEVTSEIKTRIPEFSPPALQCESIAAPTTPTSIQTFSSSFTQQFKNINVDKVTICDWNPPVPPLATSRLSEVEQLESLKKHNLFLRRELEKHNQLRRPMIDLFRNRPLNLQKSKLNWEKKSQYLLTEIIKYSTYIDRLEESVRLRREIHLERRANFEEAKE